jgi:hypothetical protein
MATEPTTEAGPLYPKINSIFKRHQDGPARGKVIVGDYADADAEYLADKPWEWTEKVDGTNIRLGWSPAFTDETALRFVGGRTDNAQIPKALLDVLVDLLRSRAPRIEDEFPDNPRVVLYGEGYGAGIQKGGAYRADPGFVLFDVTVTGRDGRVWWMKRESVFDIAQKLDILAVPLVATCTIPEAIELVASKGFASRWPGIEQPEGLVGRPAQMLRSRGGDLITTKLKWKDLGS